MTKNGRKKGLNFNPALKGKTKSKDGTRGRKTLNTEVQNITFMTSCDKDL